MESNIFGSKDGGSPPDPLWEEAREIFYQDLGQAKRAKIDDTTRLEDTITSLKLAQNKVSNEYGTHTLRVGSKDIDIKVGRIMRRLELMLQVGDAAMRFGPETVSLVWSAFRMVFTGFLKDSQVCASLFDAVDQISDILFVCQVYANQYSKERIATDDSRVAGDRVLKQIPPLYAIVLKFSYQTRKLVLDHGKVGRTLVGVFGGETEALKETVSRAKEKRDTLQGTADVAFKTAAIEILEGDSKILQDVQKTLNAVMIPIQVELTKTRDHKEKEDLEKAYREHKDWLLAGASAKLQMPEIQYSTNLKHRHPGTCRWILQTTQYETWRDQESPTLLHLLGEGGYGKSYLVSTIVEDLKNHLPQNIGSKPRLVYFFCKSGDNATQYGVKIMLHLVAQLFTACVDEADNGNDKSTDENLKYQDLVKDLNQVLKDARDKIITSEAKRDSSQLQINSVLQPMFIELARVISTKLFVVVDALDECSDLTAGFLDALKALPKSGFDIRVLVSSRPEDQIVDDLGEVPDAKIEVNKETNHADILAYIEESLKSMPRFRQLNVGPEIARKSEGMFKYANMVIESLKQSKAVRTNVQKLMKRLPDGMNDFYKQKLQSLGEDDRDMLLTALRWLMCSEGEIQTVLVADDIERCYEDSDFDEDDPESEDNEDSGFNTATMRVSTGLEAQEESFTYKDRESLRALKTVGRDFLKFSSAVLDIRHRSVRDFLRSEERSLPQDPKICPECVKRMNQESTYQASPKHGHLIMVENIFRKLISPSFQDKFITIKSIGADGANGASPPSSPQRQPSDTFSQDGSKNGNATPQVGPDIGTENQTSKDTANLHTETIKLPTQAEAANSEKANLPLELLNFDSDYEEPPRYELVQWPRHLRAAEEAWPAAERDAGMQKRWEKLQSTIEKFLSPESFVFLCWSKRLSLWEEKPWCPLHIAAYYGLLGMMQRYISYGINVDVLTEQEWTPLHLACDNVYNNVGIEYLVEHNAEVNALAKLKLTPLLLLAANNSSSKQFQYLLDHGAKPEIPDEDGWTCLHYAAMNRNLELCNILLHCATVDINAKDSEGETPLHWMFRFPNAPYELVKLFLDKGSKVNEQNKVSQGPLYSACLVGNVAAAGLLLDYGADIEDDEEVFGRTALHAAVTASNLELVKLLVERGANVHHQDKKGWDCFAQAADEDEVDILEHLLNTWKSEDSVIQHLLAQDLGGDTPLHRSALKGNDKVVEFLLNAGDAATMCSLSNHDGCTSLHMGAYGGSQKVVEVLLNKGADPMARTNQGNLPLHTAFQGWKLDYNSRNGNYGEICEKLLEFSSDAAEKADMLDLAVEKGATKLSEALAKTTNCIDPHGWTPKVLADAFGHHEIGSILAQNVYLNASDGSKSTSEAAFMNFPSRWSTVAKHPQLNISDDGLEVSCPINPEASDPRMIARTDHPIRPELSKYYYEISVLEAAVHPPILGLGFASKYAEFDQMPGWPGTGAPTWGYHGDDGKKFVYTEFGKKYSGTYGLGDTVGCGVDFSNGTIFYTKNGSLLPTAFENVQGRLFPVVGMASDHGVRIRANFGQQDDVPFMYQPQ